MHGGQRGIYDEVMTFLKTEAANFEELPEDDIQPLLQLSDAATPFEGNTIPRAKSAVGKVKKLIKDLLDKEQKDAVSVIEDHEDRIKALEDFGVLDEDSQNSVLSVSEMAKQGIENAQFVTSIRDRLIRYTSRGFPEQLTHASRLRAEMVGGDEPVVIYSPVSKLKTDCSISVISNEQELDEWLGALKKAASAELKKGNRISL